MVAGSYKLIFTLLIGSVLVIFALQAFWMRSFYIQKKEEFNLTIYSALEQVNKKLEEREHLKQVKEKLVMDALPQPDFSAKTVTTRTYAQVKNTIKGAPMVTITQVDKMKDGMKRIMISDSAVTVISANTVSMNDKKNGMVKNVKDSAINKFMNKMIMEIKILDKDERNGDTIQALIKKVLNNKGVFLPFEFALKKVFKNKHEILTKSHNYKDTEDAFVTDLSANKVFSTHNFLFLQFPQTREYMFSSMKNTLLSSLVFSIIILGVFYYVIRLILSQKKISEIRNDFVNNMTHELKTPIATISLALDAIKNPIVKNNEQKFNDYNRILKEENQKLNKHVERVLQMALLDKGELPLYKKKVELVTLMRGVADNYKLQVVDQKATVNLTTSSEQIFMMGDEQHLQTMFGNLLDNALKYSKTDCRIFIQLQQEQDGIKISFQDNGIGIDREQHAKVFDKFYRVQAGNVHDVKGFGLGLSYVKSIVEAHGGTITVQSEKGKGSEFVIRFK